jgi:hypothetical protein
MAPPAMPAALSFLGQLSFWDMSAQPAQRHFPLSYICNTPRQTVARGKSQVF